MFWRRKSAEAPKRFTFEQAKEATRRAAFLNVTQGMTADEAYRQGLAELFRTCRLYALEAGAAVGHSEAEVDAAISQLCDADNERMKAASDEDFSHFAQESGAIVKQFLSAI